MTYDYFQSSNGIVTVSAWNGSILRGIKTIINLDDAKRVSDTCDLFDSHDDIQEFLGDVWFNRCDWE